MLKIKSLPFLRFPRNCKGQNPRIEFGDYIFLILNKNTWGDTFSAILTKDLTSCRGREMLGYWPWSQLNTLTSISPSAKGRGVNEIAFQHFFPKVICICMFLEEYVFENIFTTRRTTYKITSIFFSFLFSKTHVTVNQSL